MAYICYAPQRNSWLPLRRLTVRIGSLLVQQMSRSMTGGVFMTYLYNTQSAGNGRAYTAVKCVITT